MRSWRGFVLGGLAMAAGAAWGEPPVREVGQLLFDGVPEVPAELAERMNQYQNVRPAAFRSWVPGGGVLVGTKFGEATQIHRVAAPGAARRQLTFYDDTVAGGSFGRHAGWFLFNRDAGGNEASQIYRFDLATGKAELLTEGKQQNGELVWSNGRDRIAWRSTARNGTDHDLWVMDPLRPEERRMLLEVEGYWVPLDWSPDDRSILASHTVSSTEAYYWIVDVQSGAKTPLGRHAAPDGGTIAHGKAVFDRDGSGVFLTSDEASEHLTLRHLALGSADAEELTADIPWSVDELATSRDRRRLAFTTIENGASVLWVLDAERRKRERIDLPLGTITALAFSEDGEHLGFTFNRPASPADVYSIALATRELSRWTEAEAGGLDPSTFRPAELVRFPTFDEDEEGNRRMIPAFLYCPEGDGPFPVVIDIHGGPESLSRATFSAMSQYWVNELRCAVVFPNVRGSSGFGRTWLRLDDGTKREDAVRDIGALLDWIEEREDLDEKRVGVVGSSYGGFMVLASLTAYPGRIRAGVDAVGISNFVTFLANTADYRRDLRRAEYGDERDPRMREFLLRISPTENVDKLAAPLFVIQGANDPRVPLSEAEQIVAAVRAKGGEAWFLVAKDEGHGFKKRENVDQMSYAISMFWEKHLLGREPAGEAMGASR
jgi:dipeptidyl aminopeptidase/acylaminoacyl peptidase